MKRFISILFMAVLFTSGSVFAQDSKVETGVIDYQQNRYSKSIENLTAALSNEADLKSKNVPRAYYYRGMAKMALMKQMMQDIATRMSKGEEVSEDEAKKTQNLLDEAYEDFKTGKSKDTEGKFTKDINRQLQGMSVIFLQGGLQGLNLVYTGKDQSGKVLTEEEKMEGAGEVIKFMDKYQEIDADNYMSYDIEAQALLMKKDSAEAYDNFKTAVEKFEQKEPSRPDMLIAYSCYRKGLIERYSMKDLDKALASVGKGKSLLEDQHTKIMNNADISADIKAKMEEQYSQIKGDLNNFELDILLNYPEKRDEALAKFDEQIKNEPNNYILHVAFAQLLEKLDAEKAKSIYEKAIAIDGSKMIAWFNLGAMYLNTGVEKYKEANTMDDMEKASALQKEADENFKKALPNLRKAQEIEPCDKETLKALQQILINLSATDPTLMDEYKKYKDQEKNCN